MTYHDRFAEAMEAAIHYVAETGRAEPEGLAGRLQAEGALPGPKHVWRCPNCGHQGRQGDFREKLDA